MSARATDKPVRAVRAPRARTRDVAGASAQSTPSRRGEPDRNGPVAEAAGRTVVTIRSFQGTEPVDIRVPASPQVISICEEWSYILRNRSRWVKTDAQQAMRTRAIDALERIGVPAREQCRLLSGYHVELELHPWDETHEQEHAVFDAAAQMPWEYLVGSATKGLGRYRSTWMTRVFRGNGARPRGATAGPASFLFIESGPGRLSEVYAFSEERARLNAAIGSPDAPAKDRTRSRPFRPMEVMPTRRREDIEKRIRNRRATVLHVTGIDTHQAGRLIPGFYDEIVHPHDGTATTLRRRYFAGAREIPDGIILRDTGVPELPVAYNTLAELLVPESHHPELVTLNLYYSGARIARSLVARGAGAALGFLDEVDDEVAEYFFQAFYREWVSHPRHGLAGAFERTWRHLRPHSGKLHGTGIVLWTSTSQLQPPEHRQQISEEQGSLRRTVDVGAREATRRRLRKMAVSDVLLVDLEPHHEVNYSLLHNERPLLGKLTISKLVPDTLENIEVTVELNVGAQTFQYRCTELEMDEPQRSLTDQVVIPLTAELPRSLRERVQTTVYVKVTWEGRVAFETTTRVTLTPVDEWHDDTAKNPWLPSFVIPRDPAVMSIVESARRYLVALRDDPDAGFDGYQSVDPLADDPCVDVDAQVQAIWTALVNDYRLKYINPPPVYSQQGQRLRTPSEVVVSNTGTCIDLALLLASCLEYVDIYPVIVLLTGHAFVGYWRADRHHEEFVSVGHVPRGVPSAGSTIALRSPVPTVDPFGWRLGPMQFPEIRAYARADKIRFLEATGLCSGYSFGTALAEGEENMRSRDEFDSLLDIQVARRSSPPVTPLPIIQPGLTTELAR
ncbi:MAG: hypothetical protein AB7N65_11630 [Vicinamibacterales bacterium]